MRATSQYMSDQLTTLSARESAGSDSGFIRIKPMIALITGSLSGLLLVTFFTLKGLGAVNQTGQSSPDSQSSNTTPSVQGESTSNANTTPPSGDTQPATNGGTSTSVQISNGQTHVEVNGETIEVPSNGSVHKTIQSPDGSQSVNVNIQNNSNGTSSSSSSSHSTSISTYNSVTTGGGNFSTQFNSQ